MRFESEFVAKQLLPAVRSLVASGLVNDYGLTQEEVASTMEITQPAVSQYLSGKRSSQAVREELENDPQCRLMVEEAVQKAAAGDEFSGTVGELVQHVKDKGMFSEELSDMGRL